MRELPLAELRILAPFVHFLDEKGAPVNRWLDANNLSRELVDHGTGKTTKYQFYQFLETCSSPHAIPDLGFQIGERFGMQFLGPVGQSVARAATLKDAIATFDQHLSAYLAEHRLWLERADDDVWLCKSGRDGLEELHTASNQCGLMTLISLVREATGPEWRPTHLRLGCLPSDLTRNFEAFSDAEIEFNEDDITGVRFPARFLSLPLCSSSPPSNSTPLPKPHSAPIGFSESMALMLRTRLPFDGIATVEQAAEIAGMSVRTLQRKLKSDGLTYRRLLDRTRFHIARERLLESPELQTRELAAELHYGTPSSFVRAFHRIAGMTPGDYSRMNQGE